MFGLLGKSLAHSFSPVIHKELGDYDYSLFEVEPNKVSEFLQQKQFDGINVTIPYKKTVMPFLDEISTSAKKIGCVNTIVKRKDGKLYGDNTDYYGFLYMIEKNGIEVGGKKCLVLGSGGASLTVRAVLEDLKASEIIVISRSGEDNYENLHKHYDAQIIVNTTPIGMYPNNYSSPIELHRFQSCIGVLDLIYNPLQTKLILDAKKLGIISQGGLPMLVAQAKKACEIFKEQAISNQKMESVLFRLKRRFLNVVLIGMPGCGKSTVGAILADKLNKVLVDTDSQIELAQKMKIPQIFEKFGEIYFREAESLAVKETSQKNGLVIATGGGAVLKEENVEALKQNGVLVFIDTDVEKLATSGRPLSKDKETLEKMYQARDPIYKKAMDIQVEQGETPEDTAIKILRELGCL